MNLLMVPDIEGWVCDVFGRVPPMMDVGSASVGTTRTGESLRALAVVNPSRDLDLFAGPRRFPTGRLRVQTCARGLGDASS